MGLDPSAQVQPKIAVISMPNEINIHARVGIRVHALLMGVLHRGGPMTVGLCLAVAANVEGAIARDMVACVRAGQPVEAGDDWSMVCIAHPGGLVDVGVQIDSRGMAKTANVVRTGRKTMQGLVWC
jgi:2-methylaconitate cis-trans-isomerase PrpF